VAVTTPPVPAPAAVHSRGAFAGDQRFTPANGRWGPAFRSAARVSHGHGRDVHGASATFSVTSDTAIQATVPAGASTGHRCDHAAGTATSSSASRWCHRSDRGLRSRQRAVGPACRSAALVHGATAVTFNGASASFLGDFDTVIQATVAPEPRQATVDHVRRYGHQQHASGGATAAIAGFAPAAGRWD